MESTFCYMGRYAKLSLHDAGVEFSSREEETIVIMKLRNFFPKDSFGRSRFLKTEIVVGEKEVVIKICKD